MKPLEEGHLLPEPASRDQLSLQTKAWGQRDAGGRNPGCAGAISHSVRPSRLTWPSPGFGHWRNSAFAWVRFRRNVHSLDKCTMWSVRGTASSNFRPLPTLSRHYLFKNSSIGVWNFVADTTMLGQDTNAFKSVGRFLAMATVRGEEKGTRYEFKYREK